MQLLRIDWNVIFTIVNLIVLYLGLRKFLIGPVTKVMDQRKQLIEGQMADARHVNEQANELKAQYEDALKQADISSLKTVFTGYNSFVSKISQKATGISNAENRASATYTNNGTYSKTDSLLTSSKIDEEV